MRYTPVDDKELAYEARSATDDVLSLWRSVRSLFKLDHGADSSDGDTQDEASSDSWSVDVEVFKHHERTARDSGTSERSRRKRTRRRSISGTAQTRDWVRTQPVAWKQMPRSCLRSTDSATSLRCSNSSHIAKTVHWPDQDTRPHDAPATPSSRCGTAMPSALRLARDASRRLKPCRTCSTGTQSRTYLHDSIEQKGPPSCYEVCDRCGLRHSYISIQGVG
jgi:hypothetical protein